MMATRRLEVVITGDSRDAQNAFGQLESRTESFANKMGRVGMTLTSRLTLPLVGAFALMTKAAAEEEAEIAQLDQALKNNLDMTARQRAGVEKQVTAWQNATGFADSKLRPALAKLVIAGRSWEQAQHDMTVAMDIARARGIDLETVTLAMSKAAQGQTTSLQRLGIQTRSAAGEALSFDEIMKNAAETMGGAASRHAQTAAGKMEILRNKLADIFETVGTMLLPVITKLADFLGGLAQKFQELEPWQQKVLVALVGMTAAIGPLLVAMSLVVAHPVAAALIGIAAAVALIILNFDTLKNWFSENWDQILLWAAGLKPIIEGIEFAVRLLKIAFEAVESAVRAVIRAIRSIPSLLPDVTPWEGTFPDLGFDVPGLAHGGSVQRPGLTMVGESGPELLNLPRGASVVPLGSGFGGTQIIQLHVDGKIVAEVVRPYALADQRAGRSWAVA